VLTVENNVKDYTDGQVNDHAESRNHPDATLTEKGFTRLSRQRTAMMKSEQPQLKQSAKP
jgi:phage-related tail fiber protein